MAKQKRCVNSDRNFPGHLPSDTGQRCLRCGMDLVTGEYPRPADVPIEQVRADLAASGIDATAAVAKVLAAVNGSPVHDDEQPDWVAGGRYPEVPGWYWCWDGLPNHEAVVVRVARDELGNWSWAVGAWFGEYASMAHRYPWRWSVPIKGPAH